MSFRPSLVVLKELSELKNSKHQNKYKFFYVSILLFFRFSHITQQIKHVTTPVYTNWQHHKSLQ